MTYKFVNYLWDDAEASKLDPVGRLVYRSNLLGGDQRITNTGGGNTSSKIKEKDPLTGEEVEVLWVKGSGGDLRTSKRENFSSLYQQKLLDLQKLYAGRNDKGLKSQAEDDMVAMYFHRSEERRVGKECRSRWDWSSDVCSSDLLYQQKLLDLQKLYAGRNDKGLKSQAEDDMVAMYFH